MKKSLEKAQIRHNNSLRKRLKLGNKTPCSAVLDSNGELSNANNNFRIWTPIGVSGNGFNGIFEGKWRSCSFIIF